MATIIKTLPSVPVLQSDTFEIQRQKINNLGQDIENNSSVLQVKYALIPHNVTCSTASTFGGTPPNVDSAPAGTAGMFLCSVTITPKLVNSYIRARACVHYFGGYGQLLISRSDQTTACSAVFDDPDNGNGCMSINYIGTSNTTGAITLYLRGGQAGTIINPHYSTVGVSFFEVEEVMITA